MKRNEKYFFETLRFNLLSRHFLYLSNITWNSMHDITSADFCVKKANILSQNCSWIFCSYSLSRSLSNQSPASDLCKFWDIENSTLLYYFWRYSSLTKKALKSYKGKWMKYCRSLFCNLPLTQVCFNDHNCW